MVTNAPAQAEASEQDTSQSEIVEKQGTADGPEPNSSNSKHALKASSSATTPSTSSSSPPAAAEPLEATRDGAPPGTSPEHAVRQCATTQPSSGGSGRVEDHLCPSLQQRPHTSSNPSDHAAGLEIGAALAARPATQPQVPSVTLPPLRSRQSLPVTAEPCAPTGTTPPGHGRQFAQLQRSGGSWRPAQQPPPFPPPLGPPPEAIPGGVATTSQTMPATMGIQRPGQGHD